MEMWEINGMGQGKETDLTILSTAGINLECLLIRIHVYLDAAPCAPQSSHGAALAPIVRLFAVRQVASIIASTPLAAITEQIWVGKVGTDLLGRGPEVVDGPGKVSRDVTRGDEDSVGGHALATIGQPERVVQGQGGVWVGPPVEVPVCL